MDSTTAHTHVTDRSDLRRYRTEIPNIVFDLELKQFDILLYCHLKRIAGETGACWKSTLELAAETGISVGRISAGKKVLAEPRERLGGKALITLRTQTRDDGRPWRDYLTITDIWPENMTHFGEGSPHESMGSPGEPMALLTSVNEGSRGEPMVPDKGSPGERHKKEPFKRIKGDAGAMRPRRAASPLGPGAQLYRSITNLTPNAAQREMIEAAYAAHPDRFGVVIRFWTAQGWNPKSIPGMVEVIERGTWRGGKPVIVQAPASVATLDPRAVYHGDDGAPRLKPAYGVASEYELYEMDPELPGTWPDWYAIAARAFGVEVPS